MINKGQAVKESIKLMYCRLNTKAVIWIILIFQSFTILLGSLFLFERISQDALIGFFLIIAFY